MSIDLLEQAYGVDEVVSDDNLLDIYKDYEKVINMVIK